MNLLRKLRDRRLSPFGWHTFDVGAFLPNGWQKELIDLAVAKAVPHILRPGSVTSREHSPDLELPVLTVGGKTLREEAPWVLELYEGWFRVLGQSIIDEPIVPAVDERIKANLNLQRGNAMRYECHVDSNPLEGLLNVTDHPAKQGRVEN